MRLSSFLLFGLASSVAFFSGCEESVVLRPVNIVTLAAGFTF